jgi:hypothetical protein
MQDTRIAMVQMTCRVADVAGNLATMERFCVQAAAEQVDIICFPELGVCGYNAPDTSTPDPEPLDGNAARGVEELARQYQLTVLAGLLERSVSGIVYNTHVVYGPDGGERCLQSRRRVAGLRSPQGPLRHTDLLRHPLSRGQHTDGGKGGGVDLLSTCFSADGNGTAEKGTLAALYSGAGLR